MSTIAENLQMLQNDKLAIAGAISNKGCTVPSGSGFNDFASLIETIPSGESFQTFYQQITQTSEVRYLTFSVDFEPKTVDFICTWSLSRLFTNFPEVASGETLNAIHSAVYLKAGTDAALATDLNFVVYQQRTNNSGTNVDMVSTTLMLQPISVSYNSSTNKYDVVVGLEDVSTTNKFTIIGVRNLKYDIFIGG